MSDPMTRLAELPVAAPDAPRAERIRSRCRARLERPARPTPARRDAGMGRAWQVSLIVLGVSYLTEVVIQVLDAYGRF